MLVDDTQSEAVTSTDDELFKPDNVKKSTTSFSCRRVSASKTNWTVDSKHSMSKPDDCGLVLGAYGPPEPLFPELSDVLDTGGLLVEPERTEPMEKRGVKTGEKSGAPAKVKHVHSKVDKPKLDKSNICKHGDDEHAKKHKHLDKKSQRMQTEAQTQTHVRTANIRVQVGSPVNSTVKTVAVQTEQTGEPLPKIRLLKPKVVTVELPAPPPQVITKTFYKDRIKIIQVIREVHHFADGTEETYDEQSRTDEFESEFVSDDDLDRQYNGDYLSEEDNNDADASGGDEGVLVEHADIDDEDDSFIIISDVDEA